MTRASQGWVCAHTHLYAALAPAEAAPGPAPPDFLARLRAGRWRLDRALDLEALEAAARLYVAEALLCGTTALVDHHESPACIEGSLDVLADACQELGMRAVLCYAATERNGGREEARRGLAECRRFLEQNRRTLVRGAVGVHASFTVSDETLEEAGELARAHDTVLHMHLAEDPHDLADARARGYADPLERVLLRCRPPAGSILAHGVLLDADAVRRCAERELWIVQNPRSDLARGAGYPRALGESDTVALGTDGLAPDMVDEFEVLLLGATAHGDDPQRAARRLAGGQRLINERFAGARAPRVRVELGKVTVGGRVVVEAGELQSGDGDEIRAHAAEQAARLRTRMTVAG